MRCHGWQAGSYAAVVAILLSVAGCGSHHFRHLHHAEAAPPPPPPPAVIVGGEVLNPSQLVIPPDGLTLRAALALAGGARQPAAIIGLTGPATNASPASGQPTASHPLNSPAIEATAETVRLQFQELRRAAEDYVRDPGDPQAAQNMSMSLSRRRGQLDLAIALLNGAVSGSATGASTVDPARLEVFQRLDGFAARLVTLVDSIAQHPTDESLTALQNAEEELNQLLAEASGLPIGPLPGQTLPLGERPTAGGISSFAVGTPFVALRRGEGTGALTHYFPYEFASTGLAGAILLKPEDLVQVVPLESTTLVKPPSTGGNALLVQGFVNRPGTYSVASARNIDQMLQAAGRAGNLVPDATAVVLTRTTESGIGRDVFVLPMGSNEFSTFRTASTAPQDLYTVTPVARVPILVESLLTLALRGGEADLTEVKRPLQDCHLHEHCHDHCGWATLQQNQADAIEAEGRRCHRLIPPVLNHSR